MKKIRDIENILSLPTIQNYQQFPQEIKSVSKFVRLKNGLKSFKLTLVMIWGFGQFKIVIYV